MEAKDIFISYKTDDFANAQWVKTTLESNGISCWMAPECIPGGSNYASEIPRAIRNCKVFVLILSQKAQLSNWVPKELDQAINENKVIMPFMIENCALTDAFNFYLSNVQRFAAYENQSAAIEKLIREIKALTGGTMPPQSKAEQTSKDETPIVNPVAEHIKKANGTSADKPADTKETKKAKSSNKPFFKLLAIIIIICAAAYGLFVWNDSFVFKAILQGIVFITPFGRAAAQDAAFRYPLIIYTILTAFATIFTYLVALGSFDYKNSFVKAILPLLLGFAMWYISFWLCGFIVKIPVFYTVLAFIASALSGLVLALITWLTGTFLIEYLKNQENTPEEKVTATAPAPQAVPDSPKAKANAPKAAPDSPKTTPTEPKAKSDAPAVPKDDTVNITPSAPRKTTFDVILVDAGPEKVKTVKIVKDYTGRGLKESKNIVDCVPSIVKTGVSKNEAEKIKAELEAIGAKVELK